MIKLLLVLLSFAPLAFCAIQGDLIVNLPGLATNDTGFAMYSGYITVENSRHYHYWFVEAQSSPATSPVILWLNGGPGCSSLLGLLEENGPFSPDENGNLIPNPYSWNTFANVLYLESPAGVGFSYCDNNNCPTFGDNLTASDNYEVLVNWFGGFAEYSTNDFYIMGESYGGHYVPTLANEIYMATAKNPHQAPQRNFKGFAAGNPLTDQNYDITSSYLATYMQTHGMVSLDDPNADATGNFNPYDILVDVCDSTKMRDYIRFPHPLNNMEGVTSSSSSKKRYVPNPPDCIDNFVTSYLNTPAVQSAIHVSAQGIQWENCGGPDYTFSTDSMIPLYKTFIENTKYKILVYSGDADTVLNFIATERWVLDMKLPVLTPWGPWNYRRIGGSSQLGGWTVVFQGLTFTTIKGAGHEVPWWQPAPALHLISSFVRN